MGSYETLEEQQDGLERLQIIVKGHGDTLDWRRDFKSFGQLSTDLPQFLVNGLIPANALTFITAPSYNGKTWFALQLANAISLGLPLFCFDVPQAIPCNYHVPEMNEAAIRERMQKIRLEDSENFLVRPMESGLWSLSDPRMIASSKGRVVFLDTAGYFNQADDPNNYAQALKFGQDIFALLNTGCLGVIALSHPPKANSKQPQEQNWTLENSVLGSAAYGGILRSCLRMKNLNQDLNDSNLWVYVQGIKNPGLKPFQLEGAPFRMRVAPEDSPFLRDILDGIDNHAPDPRRKQAFLMFAQQLSDRKSQRNYTPDRKKLRNGGKNG